MTTEAVAFALGKRSATMRWALENAPASPAIVETGCVRDPGRWEGDGMSTMVFAQWIRQHGGSLVSIEVDPLTAHFARMAIPEATIVTADSVEWLRAFHGRIDLLYLDSLDYPDGPLRDLYDGQHDIHAAMAALDAMTEAEIVEKHGDLVLPSQEHCAAEYQAARPNLHDGSIVVIDDAELPGGGKARLARRLLEDDGWRCVMDAYQTVWAR